MMNKDALIRSYMGTSEGWKTLVSAMVQPVRLRTDYYCPLNILLLPQLGPEAETHTEEWVLPVQPGRQVVEDFQKEVHTVLTKGMCGETLRGFCKDPLPITRKDFLDKWNPDTCRSLLLRNAGNQNLSIYLGDRKSREKRDQRSRFMWVESGYVPEDVLVPFHWDRDVNGGFMVGQVDLELLDVMPSKDPKETGLAALIKVRATWQLDNPRAQAYRIID